MVVAAQWSGWSFCPAFIKSRFERCLKVLFFKDLGFRELSSSAKYWRIKWTIRIKNSRKLHGN